LVVAGGRERERKKREGERAGERREREKERERERKRERERERETHARTHTQMPLRRLFPLLLHHHLAPTGRHFGRVCGHFRSKGLRVVFRLLPLMSTKIKTRE
jgi:hypothetical protein